MKQPIDLQQELTKIINYQQIKTLFQPIFDLTTGEILGYEALSRGPAQSPLHNPLDLFSTARKANKLFALEQVCRKKALTTFEQLITNNDHKLFMNIDPQVIYDKNFKSGTTRKLINQLSLTQENIVIELTEQTSIDDLQGFKLALDNYRQQGYKVAIDDTGAGYSGLQSIVSISYDFIKLDRSLVEGINQDSVKQALLKTLVDFSDKINSKLVAEGIEHKEDLKLLTKLGVDYGQGYLIAHPTEELATRKDIEDKVITNTNTLHHSLLKNTIGKLVSTAPTITINSNTKNKVVADQFENNDNLHNAVVLANNQPLGLIMRDDFYFRLGSQYGYAIFINKSVQSIMNQNPLIVDHTTPISQVSQQAMQRNLDNRYDSIIVTNNDKFLGTVSIKKLLDKFTTLQVEQAKNLNPLTNLPGNRFIKQEITNRINSTSDFSFLYIDLDNFKIYNDCYGYQKGDKIIEFTADLLKETLQQLGTENDFLGHIGGDDFVIITNPDRDRIISKKIIEKFDSNITQFFNQQDKARGYMLGKDRQNHQQQIPLTSLSIAIVSSDQRQITSPVQVSDIAAELKQCVKKKSGSNFMKDRRKNN